MGELVEPWDRNPVLERLEANRVYHLAIAHARAAKLRWATDALESQREENSKLKRLLAAREAEIERLRSEGAGK